MNGGRKNRAREMMMRKRQEWEDWVIKTKTKNERYESCQNNYVCIRRLFLSFNIPMNLSIYIFVVVVVCYFHLNK